MRHIAEPIAIVSNKSFQRKYIALGRIINQWREIIGEEYADKAVPVKLNYRKGTEKRKSTAVLDIATTSSYATILPYQKGLILERIKTIFGEGLVTDIRFVASTMTDQPIERKMPPRPLGMEDKKFLSKTLEGIEDPDIRERLESMGKAFLTDNTREKP